MANYCKDCFYNHKKYCRRHPPKVVVVNNSSPRTVFPSVDDYDSCGDYDNCGDLKEKDKIVRGWYCEKCKSFYNIVVNKDRELRMEGDKI